MKETRAARAPRARARARPANARAGGPCLPQHELNGLRELLEVEGAVAVDVEFGEERLDDVLVRPAHGLAQQMHEVRNPVAGAFRREATVPRQRTARRIVAREALRLDRFRGLGLEALELDRRSAPRGVHDQRLWPLALRHAVRVRSRGLGHVRVGRAGDRANVPQRGAGRIGLLDGLDQRVDLCARELLLRKHVDKSRDQDPGGRLETIRARDRHVGDARPGEAAPASPSVRHRERPARDPAHSCSSRATGPSSSSPHTPPKNGGH